MRAARARWRAAAAAAGVVVLAVGTGCGVGYDREPRALEVEPTTTTTTAAPSTGQVESVLYFVNEGTLLPVATELPDRELETVLEALLLPPATLVPSGTLTSIPSGTQLLDLSRTDQRRLTINLSTSFNNVVGVSRQQAIGQMVLTATERNEFDAIEFRVEGEPIVVASPVVGDTRTVTACDFQPLLATPGDADEAGLPEDMSEVLAARTDQLDDNC